ncbi:hypothetical protein LTR91_005817 [Friedmanniomyces endolithicus]|uniref:BTB domain-containing protein n=2 Tax=Dothideomycetidae TaxID=451867 RepID=A0AAN6KSN8_9PEZI|nr:hypothetical protein LTR94_000707 [Friedmanniomyces endolithicus]KAK5139686.1 hypothetical protein LTR32_007285 [Rachicladosporium monterosium]KAK0815346.1 hypothetical protein LTR59_000419 [Friedmanniomyces endolithicus]KAK0818133.1 hypothetical protein LTR38_001180 [Friedmanniomyces endolithicus]KAK0856762.1 hypothetical protein LTR03_001099 [Friedmanniomyces endolithicus]
MGDAAPPSTPTPPSWSRTFNYYNPLSRRSKHRAAPAPPAIYSRDFAYANNEAVVLAQQEPQPVMCAPRAEINCETSAKTFAELLSGPTVDIFVGPERKHWSLHRNLLCHHSSYFETEFEGHEVPKGGKKNGENKLELPEDDPKGFQLLVKWLYQGQMEDSSILTEEEKYEYAVACHKLYALCDKFDMIHLKNLAMDLYRANLNAAQLVPDADEINDIYRGSPPGSPFRTLMTKIAARQIMDPDVDKDAETYRKCFQNNPDFAVEMVNAIRHMSGGMLFDDPTEVLECAYHDHSDGSYCGEKRKAVTKSPAIGTGKSPGAHHDGDVVGNPSHPSQQGEGPKTSVAKRQLPAELSAEKRTPRKLNVQPPKSPTPKPLVKRQAALTNGNAPSTPPKSQSTAPSQASTVNGGPPKQPQPPSTPPKSQPTAPSQASTVNGGPPKQPQALPNGHAPTTPAKAPPSAPSQAGTANGDPPKLAQTPVKFAPPANSVLGKRRATDGTSRQPNGNSATEGPRRSSHSVNGMVQHLSGASGASSSDGSQSQGGASEMPIRKVAPKLRRPQGNST